MLQQGATPHILKVEDIALNGEIFNQAQICIKYALCVKSAVKIDTLGDEVLAETKQLGASGDAWGWKWDATSPGISRFGSLIRRAF